MSGAFAERGENVRVRMVQRADYGTNTYLNGIRSGEPTALIKASEIGNGVVATTRSEPRSFCRRSHRFSLFKWFRRGGKHGSVSKIDAAFSSTDSIDTFYSTATVRSFAFQAGPTSSCNGVAIDALREPGKVGPFGPGVRKFVNLDQNVTCTLPAALTPGTKNVRSRYSLQPCAVYDSYGSLPIQERAGESVGVKEAVDAREVEHKSPKGRRRVHVKGKRRAPNPPESQAKAAVNAEGSGWEVNTKSGSGRRKRRPAPKPPDTGRTEVIKTRQVDESASVELMQNESQSGAEDRKNVSISNDTLILQGGILLSKKENSHGSVDKTFAKNSLTRESSAFDSDRILGSGDTLGMPRPWYKRSVAEQSRDKRSDTIKSTTMSTDIRDEDTQHGYSSSFHSFPFEGSLSRLGFFQRKDRHNVDKRRDSKRKSGLSILTNISELDKEAAAIVQEEQARARASMMFQNSKFLEIDRSVDASEELVQGMVASALENSPRRTTRALISKFNAIGNVTKITVNTSFLSKNTLAKDRRSGDFNNVSKTSQEPRTSNAQFRFKADNFEHEYQRDISKYFLPHQRSPNTRSQYTKLENRSNDKVVNQAITEIRRKDDYTESIKSSDKTHKHFCYKKEKAEISGISEEDKRYKNKDASKEALCHSLTIVNIDRDNKRQSYGQTESISNTGLDTIQRQFTNIFDEIDKLRARDSKLDEMCLSQGTNYDASNQVKKITSGLVNEEKEKNIIRKNHGTKISIEKEEKIMEKKTPILNTVDDQVTADLKEMLKEMKHSLPKRPKSLKSESSRLVVNNQPSTSSFCEANLITVNSNNKVQVSMNSEAPQVNGKMEERDSEKQKVSSSVQTSGNLRKIVIAQQPSASTDLKNQDGITNDRGAFKAITKNYHLIRPKDFAEMEVVRTVQENTYANVIKEYIYTNDTVQSVNFQPSNQTANAFNSKKVVIPDNSNNPVDQRLVKKDEPSVSNAQEETQNNIITKNMNTLAVNRLLRKLELAIASGHHQQAAVLAKELARLKIPCSVVRQSSNCNKDVINVNMYIEDKKAHQGPIPLQLAANMTVAQLKQKIYAEFEIPQNVQRWIIGKNLADNDDSTLQELHAMEGSPIFLYLVVPDTLDLNKIEHITKKKLASSDASSEQKSNEDEKENKIPKTTEIDEEVVPEKLKVKRYEELMSLENCDVILNSEPTECPICFMNFGPQEGVILRDCLHTFCKMCIANTVLYCEDAEVKCPYRDTEYTCESTLQEREIKALVAPEVYQQHLAKSIAQAENNAGNNAFHCKTPDCPGWCIYDDNVNNFLCPVCHANNCLTCQAVHMGKNCRQYQEEIKFSKETDQESKRTAAMLEEMVDRGEALQCPTCAVVLMKKWGCDWLRCSMCKTEICWVTRGPRWGPGGKGDTSGGCRCGENGIKCHPRCNYCH